MKLISFPYEVYKEMFEVSYKKKAYICSGPHSQKKLSYWRAFTFELGMFYDHYRDIITTKVLDLKQLADIL